MFERFTEKAIKVIMLAQEEARRLGHNFVGTEQILLGLVGEGTGIAAKVLKQMGINLKDARVEVEKIIGRGSGFVAVEIPFTPRAKRVLELAWEEARQLGHNYIGTEHLLLGLIGEGEGVATKVLQNLNVNLNKIHGSILKLLSETGTVTSGVGASSGSTINSSGGSRSKTPTLDEFGTDLTQAALEGRLDPVIGRADEIERAIQILGRRTKNNPVLIGEPGVGKTAIADGLSQKIAFQEAPEPLLGKKIVQLDVGLLVAGTKYRGEFEERLKKIMEEIKSASNIILVIDELHTLVGAGAAEGAIDAANILKPVLARGELRCIGATTPEEYRKHVEKDSALERRFQPIKVEEPSLEETIQILGGLKSRYEKHHDLTITKEAVEAAVFLSERYISDRYLPDKAIDLIDEAGSFVRLTKQQDASELGKLREELKTLREEKELAVREQNFERASTLKEKEQKIRTKIEFIEKSNLNSSAKPNPTSLTSSSTVVSSSNSSNNSSDSPEVSLSKSKLSEEKENRDKREAPEKLKVQKQDIARVVSRWTGIPVGELNQSESKRLMEMEKILHSRVVGQDRAVLSVSQAIKRARVGLKKPSRPIGSFIFAGPTGVGKTELAKSLASFFFGSEEAIIRVDMSEFMEKHTTSRLVGSPPGYVGYGEGGELTERVRRKPYSVVLFDEVEKAHQDVFNVMLQILDDGRLTDSKGRVVSFKNTIIIMTTNIGAKAIENEKETGFSKGESLDQNLIYKRMQRNLMNEMKDFFKPEFLNRVDEIIIFHRLHTEHLLLIFDLMAKDLEERLEDKGLKLTVSQAAKEFLCRYSQTSDRQEGVGVFHPSSQENIVSKDGARPLRRVIEREIENRLANAILEGKFKPGDQLLVDLSPDKKEITVNKNKEALQDSSQEKGAPAEQATV